MILVKLSSIPQFRPAVETAYRRVDHDVEPVDYRFRLCQLSSTKFLIVVSYYINSEKIGSDYFTFIGKKTDFYDLIDILLEYYEYN